MLQSLLVKIAIDMKKIWKKKKEEIQEFDLHHHGDIKHAGSGLEGGECAHCSVTI